MSTRSGVNTLSESRQALALHECAGEGLSEVACGASQFASLAEIGFHLLQGFLKCWKTSGLCDKVSQRMTEITHGMQGADKDLRVIVTGRQPYAKLILPCARLNHAMYVFGVEVQQNVTSPCMCLHLRPRRAQLGRGHRHAGSI